jgi:DNA-binding response OmpR family regulator
MKIAIFENEYDTVEIAFKYLNKKYFNLSLKLENYPSSDSFSDLKNLQDYSLIIVDIDLSSQSTLDGFGLIKKIEKTLIEPYKILILTGQALSENYDIENGLSKKYTVLEKPINYNKLNVQFEKLGIKYIS